MTISRDKPDSRDEPERVVTIKAGDPNPGRIDRSRFGKPNPADAEPYPATSPEIAEATRTELTELRRRMTRRTA